MSANQLPHQQILDTINDGILVIDHAHILLYANPAAQRMLNCQLIPGQSLHLGLDGRAAESADIDLHAQMQAGWLETQISALDWQGNAAHIVTLRDVSARQKIEQALQNSEAQYRTLAKTAPVGIFRTDAQGQYHYVNERWSEISGHKAHHALNGGWLKTIHPDDRNHVWEQWQYSVQTQIAFNCQYRLVHPDGSTRWVIARASAEWDELEQLQGYVGTITEITEIKNSEQRLSQAAPILENTREGVMITDAQGHVQMVNRAFCEISGYVQSEILGQTPLFLRCEHHPEHFYVQLFATLKQYDHWQGEIWITLQNDQASPMLLSISALRNADGMLTHFVAVFADIAKAKSSENELQFLAHHDPLTKLPNRVLFQSRLQHCLERAQRRNSIAAILMLDLDRFKEVNDSFGHLAGDELLILVAEALSKRLRSSDTICRLGGDEFIVLLEEIADADAAARVAQQLIEALNKAWSLSGGHEARIGTSIGIALYPDHGDTPEELMQQADAALYKAKHEGRNRFKYFSEDLTLAARERLDIETRLREAVENHELQVFYQPQIDVANRQIVGAEALIRWQTANGEFIPPSRFILVAEETGLIGRIGAWVLQEVCRQGQQWLQNGLPALRLAVNLSSHQLIHSNIAEAVSDALTTSGFPADHLELELTEQALMRHEQQGISILQDLHKLGVHLAIDDFGTGYSSLAYLKLFPLNVLKIDKSFIEDIHQQDHATEITATIIAMAKTLRMRVTAEGVETEEQLDFLQSRECDQYQGFLTCRPLPAKAFEIFANRYQPDNPEYNHRLATELAMQPL
jgi:diguanylate cyclase (GGDEF)-like protein/PAS domain S-box-containing protein